MNPHGILKDHTLAIALAFSLRLDTIEANGLFLSTFNPAVPTCCIPNVSAL